jgi:hypothetical protein
MIPVVALSQDNEPRGFDKNCRVPGARFLAAYPERDPHEKCDWWSAFKPELAEHFHHRCGWMGTVIGLEGDVDHFLACGHRKGKPSPYQSLAFEWANLRYICGIVNSRKGSLDDQILDPCEVGAGWFEVLLPSFQLIATDAIPTAALRSKARLTLERLDLRRGYHARWSRWDVYRRHWNGGRPNMPALAHDAPLIAAAVQRLQALGHALPDPAGVRPRHRIPNRKREYSPRVRPSTSTPPNTQAPTP